MTEELRKLILSSIPESTKNEYGDTDNERVTNFYEQHKYLFEVAKDPMQNYSVGDTISDELHNNLVIIDSIINKMSLRVIPEFHIVGGAALTFHGLNNAPTLDIDTGNAIDTKVKDAVGEFIDDAASEVIIRPINYTRRLVDYPRCKFSSIVVKMFSIEDLVITKLGTGRTKDISDLRRLNLIESMDRELFNDIVETELTKSQRNIILGDLDKVME